MSLKHDFGCVDKCCSHSVVLDDVVSNQDVDVEEICISHGLSSSLSGNVAPGALARDIHRGKRSHAAQARDDPTGPSAPVVVQPLGADRVGIDDDDDIYKLDDDNDTFQPLKTPQFSLFCLTL